MIEICLTLILVSKHVNKDAISLDNNSTVFSQSSQGKANKSVTQNFQKARIQAKMLKLTQQATLRKQTELNRII